LIDNQPKYIRNGINGLPALLFDGSNDFFSFNGDFLVGADYTIFVVEARGSGDINTFMTGSGTLQNTRLILGYSSDIFVIQTHYQSDFFKSIPKFKSQVPRMHSFVFSKINGKSIYTNGGSGAFNATQRSPLISYAGAMIGRYTLGLHHFKGYIAEIIFYTRALSDKERQEVELYLSKKWGIKIG
jgi:hypothetical protein